MDSIRGTGLRLFVLALMLVVLALLLACNSVATVGCPYQPASAAIVGDGTISVFPATNHGGSCWSVPANTPITIEWQVSPSVLGTSFDGFDVFFKLDTESLNPTASRAGISDSHYSLTATFPKGTGPFSVEAGGCAADVCTDSEHIVIFLDPASSGTPRAPEIPTIYPIPQTAEEAAAVPLNCRSYLAQDNDYDPDMYNYPDLESGIGEATPEEAFNAFRPYTERTPDFIYRTEDEVIWVYLNEGGQKIDEITAQHTDAGWFIIREQYCASVLK